MLSYRHAFHAGNHADVLKHFCLFEVISYFKTKDKPFIYIETHSGAGIYSIKDKMIGINKEYTNGVAQILNEGQKLPQALLNYRNHVELMTPDDSMIIGSPYLALSLFNCDNTTYLYELHKKEYELLKEATSVFKKNKIILRNEDGLKGLISILPPTPRRVIVLIDPPYEVHTEYDQVVDTITQSLKKFETGCYLIWYPCLCKKQSIHFPRQLEKISSHYLNVELHVKSPNFEGFGMHGSGMWIINPPYLLRERLKEVLPTLIELLGQDSAAQFILKDSEL